MDHFDELATDPAVRLPDVEAYLDTLRGNERFAGRYWVSATSSGRKSIIPTDAHEWAAIIASYARANEWAGIRAGLNAQSQHGDGQVHDLVASVVAGRRHGA